MEPELPRTNLQHFIANGERCSGGRTLRIDARNKTSHPRTVPVTAQRQSARFVTIAQDRADVHFAQSGVALLYLFCKVEKANTFCYAVAPLCHTIVNESRCLTHRVAVIILLLGVLFADLGIASRCTVDLHTKHDKE